MSIELTAAQSKAVERLGAALAPVSDPHTHKAYLLVRKDLYRRPSKGRQIRTTDDLADTYPAQIESAMRAGWNNPQMDEYDEYDAHFQA